MSETIHDGKYVELTYKVTDKKSGHVLTMVEFPLGYVHGHNEILAPSVHMELEGKSAGDVIEVPIDANQIFGPRDESLVFTDRIGNVPEEYRQVGTSILMENDRGQTRSFLVTRIDEDTFWVVTGNRRFFVNHSRSIPPLGWVILPGMTSQQNCPFCNLHERVLKTNDTANVILSNPHKVPGHFLVTPKRHIEKPWELTSQELQDIFELIFFIEQRIVGELGEGLFLLGEVALAPVAFGPEHLEAVLHLASRLAQPPRPRPPNQRIAAQ